MELFVNINGQYRNAREPVLHSNNRGFRHGDAVCETMRANGKVIHFFEDHLTKLIKGMKALKMQVPAPIRNHTIQQEITRLLHKNRHLKGAGIRLTVFRDPSENSFAQDNACTYLIETEKLPSDAYALNTKGLMVDLFPELKEPVSPFSHITSPNQLFYVMADLYRKEHHLDECLLINTREKITGTINSNIFMVSRDIIKTPSLASGCREGIMRSRIIQYAEDAGIMVNDQDPVWFDELMTADEIFLTNTTEGIQWIAGIRQKRYFKETAKKLMGKLRKETALD